MMRARLNGPGKHGGAKATRLTERTNLIPPSYIVCFPFTVYAFFMNLNISSPTDESTTQPTRARWEALPDRGRVLGGTKAGGAAWGLAWVDTIMQSGSQEYEDEQAKRREELLRAAGVDLNSLYSQTSLEQTS